MKVSKENKRKAVVLKLINDERKSKRLLSVTACSYYDCENTMDYANTCGTSYTDTCALDII